MLEPRATIAVVGASARAAAFSLLRAGYNVVAADLFIDADLAEQCEATRVTRYPEGFADWLAQTDCDAWLYTGALENYPSLVERLSVSRPLIGHAGNVLRRVRDPLQLQEILADANLNFPKTHAARTFSSADSNWLGKTYRASCGSGVGREGADYWQRYVVGTPLSAVYRGEQLLGLTRQLVGEAWTGASEFKYCGTIAPWAVSSEKLAQLEKLGKLLSDEVGLTELYGVDLIDDGERLWTIEVNPRYTAAVEVVERSLGVCVFNSTLKCPPLGCCGKVVVFAKAPCLITEEFVELVTPHQSSSWTAVSRLGNWPTFADIPSVGTETETGQPVITLFADGETYNDVYQRLQLAVVDIEKKLYARTSPCV